MENVLVTSRPARCRRWQQAFPGAVQVSGPGELSRVPAGKSPLIWLDLATGTLQEKAQWVQEASAYGRAVALVAALDDTEAFHLLRVGAVGYCHLQAAPRQLREAADVVAGGGLWMPPGVVQRFLLLSRRLTEGSRSRSAALSRLTAREQSVAQLVAGGASNREIAEALQISERTVKAHLSAVFEKLGVRDRVQLALVMHDLPVPESVN